MSHAELSRPPLAVVGVSALFPGSLDETGFWRDILAGRDLLRDVPPSHWLVEDYYDPDPTAPDKTYARRGAFLDPILFDALAHGLPPSLIPATDTSQLLALIVAQRVLDDATSGQFATVNKERTSVILGVTSGQELLSSMVSRLQRPVWVKCLREAGLPESQVTAICERLASHYVPWQEATFPGLLGNVVAGRIANRFDLGGTNCVTDAACASTLAAVSMAMGELYSGQSDLVVTGGVDTLNDPFMYLCFSKTPALSPTGDCRPFDADADGTMLGEGLGMVALKRLADAEAAGDRIYAVLRGMGSSSDGRARSVYAPRPEGQARALARAYQAAGYGPETVELVEAHGTGTIAGDVAEVDGLRLVFDAAGRRDRQWCALGSVKSQIGHTKAAAGAAGLFKTVMALLHGALPPTIKVARPNPKLQLESSPFYLSTQARPWVRGTDHPRRASVSAFGFGGSNFHLALEEYRGPAPRALRRRTAPAELVLISGASPEAVAAELRSLESEAGQGGFLTWLARASQEQSHAGAVRLALLATDEADLRAKLAAAAQALTRSPGETFSLPGVHCGVGAPEGKLAFLFPGQGSQYLGMGAGLALGWREALSAWDLAADLPAGGERLQHVVFPRPASCDEERTVQEERLKRTEWAQPALGAASLAQLNLLAAIGLRPDCVGGHSFGEVVALHAAGVFDAETMLRIARRRGELMAEAARVPGAMSAVRATLDQVEQVLAEVPGVVIANHNAPRQAVLSGSTEAIARAEAALRARGVGFDRLAVATAFHSPLVGDSVEPFAEYLRGVPFLAPTLPVYGNAEAAPYPEDPGAIRTVLAGQLVRRVRFVQQIEAMYADGVRTFIEVGAGGTLGHLTDRILEGRPHLAVSLDSRGREAAAAFQEGLGRLWAAGIPMNLGALWTSFVRTADPRQAKRPAVAIPICGTNYGKPYPPAAGASALPPPNPEPSPVEPQPDRVPAAEAPAAEAGAAWLAAFQQAQQATLEAQTSWQNQMTQTHLAFLQAVERSFATLAAIGGGELAAQPLGSAQIPGLPAAPALPLPLAQPLAPAASPAPAVAAPAAPVASPRTDRHDLSTVLLGVVAEKTGYPVEMLGLTMGLESDLGIDSIKRVEILAGLRERLSDLPELDPAELGSLRTLAEIVERLKRAKGSAPEARAASSGGNGRASHSSSTGSCEPAPSAAAPGDLSALLLAVVAEKTGYPAEMLSLEMGLEADLGIDSIKRVEILAGLRERRPDLPEVDAAQVAATRTLGDIVAGIGRSQARGASGEAHAAVGGSAHPGSTGGSSASRHVIQAVESAPAGLGLAGFGAARRIAILGDGDGVAEALGEALRDRGLSAERVEEVPPDADAVLALTGLAARVDPESAGAAVRATFRAARAVAPRFTERGGVFVTVQDTGGDFGLSGSQRAWLGGIAGIAKSAALEWPAASVKAIDIARGDRDAAAVAQAILGELESGGLDLEVGLADRGRRLVPQAVATELVAEEEELLDQSSVVVASGGGRGVTAACLVALAARVRGRYLLLGRTPLTEEPPGCRGTEEEGALRRALLDAASAGGHVLAPAELAARAGAVRAGREVRATLRAIGAAGGEARYLALDIRDRAALAVALSGVRAEWGPITALVHGAGTIADRRIADKTDSQFDSVFDTKVLGLRALLELTAADPLRLICLFSSVAGRFGNIGQCDYAAANSVLDQLAALEARRRGPGCQVKSIAWGPWDGGMVTPSLSAHFRQRGTPLLSFEAGASGFVSELLARTPGPSEVMLVAAGERPAAPHQQESPMVLEVLVSEKTHPYLADHSIEDVPVLPVVMVLEWFMRAARVACPELQVAACLDLRVLRGASLRRFRLGGDRFLLQCRPADAGSRRVLLELRATDGTLHYTATADLAERLPSPGHAPSPSTPLQSFVGPIYGRELFHGPEFQVIRSLEGVSADGAWGTLAGTRDQSWSGNWCTDAAATDGGLQLAVLWAGHVLGGRSLPTAVGAHYLYRPGCATGPIRCAVSGEVLGESKSLCDIALISQDGGLISELHRVELHRRPDLLAAP